MQRKLPVVCIVTELFDVAVNNFDLYLSFSELNSIESTESIEFVEFYF